MQDGASATIAPTESGLCMKGRPFRARISFALAGIRIVWRRERSFRAQVVLGSAALALTAFLRPGWIWLALLLLSTGVVLAFEMINAALEYAIDRFPIPEIAGDSNGRFADERIVVM